MIFETDGRRISTVRGLSIEMLEYGKGRPLLFLGAGIGIDPGRAAIELLSQNYRVIVPSHPGFGDSERPRSLTTVDDLSYFYLDFLREHRLREVLLVGVSFGGWIAAEIAVKSTADISALVLADAVGIKVSDRETRDIADVFQTTDDKLYRALYATAQPRSVDYKAMPDADVLTVARNRETLARFAWSPYMHNPKLKDRLHRIDVPTLVLWGAEDGIVPLSYGKAFCTEIPDGQFAAIAEAGHLPQIDQPEAFARHIANFGAEAQKSQRAGAL